MEKTVNSIRTIHLAFLSIFFLFGCAPVSTFQSPAIINGRTAVGLGTAVFTFEKGDVTAPIDGNIWLRLKTGSRSEIGIRGALLEGVTTDFKYNIINADILFSVDLGYSYSSEKSYISPQLLFGTENIYVGYKYALPTDRNLTEALRVIMLGASLGNKVKIMPEVNFWGELNSGTTFVTYGIGFLFTP